MDTPESLSPQEIFNKEDSETISKRKLIGKGLLVASCAIVILMGLIFLLSLLYSDNGTFTVRVGDSRGTTSAISLSETSGFANPTEVLHGIPMDKMPDTTYDWLPLDQLDSIPGSHNGKDYIAYTFYVKNDINTAIDYNVSFIITEATRNVDKAVRVMIYRNGTPTVYASCASNGGTETVPANIVNFESEYVVASDIKTNVKPNEINKYTIVIWLEGEDPQCKNDILKGIMKFEVNIKQIIDD